MFYCMTFWKLVELSLKGKLIGFHFLGREKLFTCEMLLILDQIPEKEFTFDANLH